MLTDTARLKMHQWRRAAVVVMENSGRYVIIARAGWHVSTI